MEMPKELGQEVLDIEMEGEFEHMTLRDFFKELALQVWVKGEGFSGKRPFGDSGWEYDVYLPLIRDGIVPGKLDEYGFIADCDSKAIHKLVTNLVVEYL